MVYVPHRTESLGSKLSPRTANISSHKARSFRIISGSEAEITENRFKSIGAKEAARSGFTSQDRDLVLGDDELDFDYDRWRSGCMTGYCNLNVHAFPNPKTELFFWNYYEKKHKNLVRLYVLVLTIGTIFCIPIFDFDENLSFEERIRTLLVRCAQLTWSLLYGIFFLKDLFDPYNMEALLIFNLGLAVTFLFLSVIGDSPNHGPYVILMLVVHLFCGLGNKLSSIFATVVFIGFSVMAKQLHDRDGEYTKSIYYLFAMLAMSTLMGQYLEFNNRKIFFKKHKLRLEQARSDAVLNAVLPPSVAMQLKKGEKYAREYKYSSKNRGVSVMFVQICNFEEKTNDFKVDKLVLFLNNVFSHFDDLTEKWDVFKVETVGEVYMAAAGVPSKCIDPETQRPDHARRLADLAIDIKKFSGHLLNFEYSPGERRRFQIRIGLNTGTVIAGVVGRRLPRYRLIGDTVNVASRMESTAKPGTIQATINFVHLLPDRQKQYDIVPRENVFVKGKGQMTVWVLRDGKMPRHQASRCRDSSRQRNAMDVLSFLQEGRRIHATDRYDMLSSRYQSEFLNLKNQMSSSGLVLPANPNKYIPPPPPPTDSEAEDSEEDMAYNSGHFDSGTFDSGTETDVNTYE